MRLRLGLDRGGVSVAAVLACTTLAGSCGGGGSSGKPGAATSARSGGASGAAGSSQYRWLVPTAGAPPSVSQENRAQGTRAWRLPGAVELIGGAAHGAIAGYVSEQAVAAGETESVYVSALRARSVRLRVYRMGWYGGEGGRLVLASGALPAYHQTACARSSETGASECDWRASLRFTIPSALVSGVYVVKLRASTGAESDCMFVVRPSGPARLLVQIPTATYEAYNAWGGNSLYPGSGPRVGATGTSQGVEVSYDRPYDSQTGAGQFFAREVAIVRFLERYGYPVGYTTSESLDRSAAQARGASALIDVGHSEYWSTAEAHAFTAARDRGTSLLFLSSDTMAWRVRFAPAGGRSSEAGAPDHRIVAYKEFASRDPDTGEPSGVFPGGGAGIVGSAYDGCITPRLAVPGPPVYRYYDWAPAPSLRPAWLFAGTGLTAASRITGIVGYELDERTAASPPSTRLLGSGTGATCMPQSEPAPANGTAAETTLYTAPSGALVFATGTLGWLYGLSPVAQASPDVPLAPDPRLVAMTRNLLARVLSG